MSLRLLLGGFYIFLISLPLMFGYPLSKVTDKVSQIVDLPREKSYSQGELLGFVNEIRTDKGLLPVVLGGETCAANEQHFMNPDNDVDNVVIEEICEECKAGAFLSFENRFFSKFNPWVQDEEVVELVTEDFDYMCLVENDVQTVLSLFKTSPIIAESSGLMAPINPKNFSENDLWQALVDYRHAHQKPDLLRAESLCVYGRERVAEHITMMATVPQEEYPNSAKYPLDFHAGFQRDGSSGYLFEKTDFMMVAENLAYWPQAAAASQVIEWGWDTSTEGHREAQLSTDYTHACLTGNEGFYVALFGRN